MHNKFDKDLKLLKEQHRVELSQHRKELLVIHEKLIMREHDQTTHQSEQNIQDRVKQIVESQPPQDSRPPRNTNRVTNIMNSD